MKCRLVGSCHHESLVGDLVNHHRHVPSPMFHLYNFVSNGSALLPPVMTVATYVLSSLFRCSSTDCVVQPLVAGFDATTARWKPPSSTLVTARGQGFMRDSSYCMDRASREKYYGEFDASSTMKVWCIANGAIIFKSFVSNTYLFMLCVFTLCEISCWLTRYSLLDGVWT